MSPNSSSSSVNLLLQIPRDLDAFFSHTIPEDLSFESSQTAVNESVFWQAAQRLIKHKISLEQQDTAIKGLYALYRKKLPPTELLQAPELKQLTAQDAIDEKISEYISLTIPCMLNLMPNHKKYDSTEFQEWLLRYKIATIPPKTIVSQMAELEVLPKELMKEFVKTRSEIALDLATQNPSAAEIEQIITAVEGNSLSPTAAPAINAFVQRYLNLINKGGLQHSQTLKDLLIKRLRLFKSKSQSALNFNPPPLSRSTDNFHPINRRRGQREDSIDLRIGLIGILAFATLCVLTTATLLPRFGRKS